MYAARLEEWDDDVLFRAARDVKALMEQPGWLSIQTLLSQVKEKHERMLTDGKTLDHPDMARMLGVMAGLRAAADAAASIVDVSAETERERKRKAEAA